MVSLKEILSLWGFSDHPFEAYTAETEVRLTDYFVAPPYLDDALGSAEAAAAAIVFGTRGAGKSAIRIYTENLCLSGDPNGTLGGKVVAVTYDDFAGSLKNGLDRVTLSLHVESILRKMICASLMRITQRCYPHERPSRETVQAVFPKLDIGTFSRLVRRYFTSLSEFQKEGSFRGVYDFFKTSAVSSAERMGWFQKIWANLRVPLIDIANLFQAVRGKDQIDATGFAPHDPEEKGPATDVMEDFATFANMTPQLEIDAWYILIDKVDEDEVTAGEATKSAKLVLPLVKSLRLLETPYVAFKFFLWDQLRPIFTQEKVRLDKIRNFTMTWTPQELRYMIDRRLSAYSSGAVKDLNMIVVDSYKDKIYDLIIEYSTSAPREMVQILDSIFREHARHSTAEDGAVIHESSIDRGLDDYCSRRVQDLYPPGSIRQITQLKSVTFTNTDIQLITKRKQQTASYRINNWLDNGYIERIEDVPSQKDPSKFVYQYRVREPRLRRILERRLIQAEPTREDTDEDEPNE